MYARRHTTGPKGLHVIAVDLLDIQVVACHAVATSTVDIVSLYVVAVRDVGIHCRLDLDVLLVICVSGARMMTGQGIRDGASPQAR